MADRSFVEENEASRRELGEIIGKVRQRDFHLEGSSGCSISMLLCHLAFWDQRILFLLGEWQSGRFETSRLSPLAIDSINHAVKVISTEVPPSAAARLALDSAAAIDSRVAGIADDLIEKIVSAGFEWVLKRSLHRRAHLSQIQKALGPV